ncbi:hypothetical protein ACI8AV_00970 [Geodermatophilus sp. SYSU D00804]
MQVLFVCTGNLCRSPLAERLAAAWTADSSDANSSSGGIHFRSAGVLASPRLPMHVDSARALRRLGGDPEDFRSQRLTAEVAARADLVLTMTRDHRREVLRLNPKGLRRTFTLKEASDLIKHADLDDLWRSQTARRATELGGRLHAARSWRATTSADDIADPIGRRPAVHDEVAAAIAETLRPVLAALCEGARPRAATSGLL